MSDSHVDRGTDLGYEGSAMNFGTAMHNRYEHVPDPREGEARAAKKAHTSFWREPDVVGVDGGHGIVAGPRSARGRGCARGAAAHPPAVRRAGGAAAGR